MRFIGREGFAVNGNLDGDSPFYRTMENRSARDYIARLWQGTLYERLAAAADLAEDAGRAAEEWNDYAAVLSALGRPSETLTAPALDAFKLQERILAAYGAHPLLRSDQPLAELIGDGCSGDVAALVTPTSGPRMLREAAYIDNIRREIGALRVRGYLAAG